MSKDDVGLIEVIVGKNEGVLRVFLTPFATSSCVTLDLNGRARARVKGREKRIARNAGDPRKDVAVPVTECCTRTGRRAKNERTRGCDEGSEVQETRGGRVGVGNGAWIESLYGNEKLRRKSVERNAETFDFTRRQSDVTAPN